MRQLVRILLSLCVLAHSFDVFAVINLPTIPATGGSCGSGQTLVLTAGGTNGCVDASGPTPIGVNVPEIDVTSPAVTISGQTQTPITVHIPTSNTQGGYVPSSGWIGTSSNNMTPVSTLSPSLSYICNYNANCTNQTTPTLACSQLAQIQKNVGGASISSCSGTVNGTSNPYTCTDVCQVTGGGTITYGPYSITQSTTCPSGYTSNGTTCNLTNASAVIKPTDGHCNVVRSGNSFSYDPNDPDCTAAGAPVVSSGTVTQTSNSAGGGSVSENSSTGAITVNSNNNNNSNNTTTNNTTILDNTGRVTGTNQTTTQGQGTGATTTQSTSSGSGQSVDVSNLATHADVNGVASAINTMASKMCGGVGQPACKLDETGTPTDINSSQGMTDANTAINGNVAAVQNEAQAYAPDTPYATNPLQGLPQGTCTPLSISGWGAVGAFTLNPCPMVQSLQPLVEWMLWVLGALFLWFRFQSVQSGVSE
jgi:hypothetical protein